MQFSQFSTGKNIELNQSYQRTTVYITTTAQTQPHTHVIPFHHQRPQPLHPQPPCTTMMRSISTALQRRHMVATSCSVRVQFEGITSLPAAVHQCKISMQRGKKHFESIVCNVFGGTWCMRLFHLDLLIFLVCVFLQRTTPQAMLPCMRPLSLLPPCMPPSKASFSSR